MLANVKIEQDEKIPYKHRLTINDVDFGNCACRVEIEANSIPEVKVTMHSAAPEFMGKADVKFDFMPESVEQAVFILHNELLQHGALYDGFLASIESSVREQKLQGLPFQPEHEIAEKILRRIIGEE